MWHFVKGYRNAPIHSRLSGGLTAARIRAPILGGNFGVWGGLFAVFDCSLAFARGVEDPWNAIMAGGLTGGVLAARAGPRAIGRNAVVGMVLIALIEGVGIAINKFTMNRMMAMQAAAGGKQHKDTLDPPIPPGFGSKVLIGGGMGYEQMGFQLR
jgi:mitochondrial import inner membrane translocase subunit TIM17